ncbi:MAG: MBL fold metallo-hydrolase [Chloroflexota bacterium]|jgi:ribonuclease Z|nr:MBL fold metallo-hydrolase [Chloroflexota bacterium]
MGAKRSLALEVTIIGCGTPTPLPDRFGSSYVVQVGDEKLLFDCGPATTWKLARAGISTTEIDNVFFTHHHFDHDADFPTFILTRWDQMIPTDRMLNVYGPRLTEEFTNGIIDEDTGLFAHDWKARVNHPASQITFADRGGILPRKKPEVDPHNMGPGLIKSGANWEVTAARAEHVQPYLDSLAYRIDTSDGSVVLTGDTTPCDTVTELARGADVLMMMCWESHDRMDGNEHAGASSSIQGAAETAAEAGVKQLVMVHIGARLTTAEMKGPREIEAAKAWDGKIIWGDEMMKVPWPER